MSLVSQKVLVLKKVFSLCFTKLFSVLFRRKGSSFTKKISCHIFCFCFTKKNSFLQENYFSVFQENCCLQKVFPVFDLPKVFDLHKKRFQFLFHKSVCFTSFVYYFGICTFYENILLLHKVFYTLNV